MQDFEQARREMVELLRRRYRIHDERVLAVMEQLPRHLYIPEPFRGDDAYDDHPCPVGFGQTISQPYIVAYMTQALAVQPGDKVLEIGTGSGYQAAVLAGMGADVFTIERIPELAEHARAVLGEEVAIRCGDGTDGWPEEAPFDIIIGTCAPEKVPPILIDQLAGGGRMMLPVGDWIQRLVFLRRQGGEIIHEDDLSVRFVPMIQGAGPQSQMS
ncbi:MAG: protein-L-isoaspartate(D-aspartate) O-methyltransferase [Kiritimatiellales bacterium]|nr:protein-L-isoaspartate(D-aspartate) O-methyltransferase [Kiritimatiellota bacterium]MBL7011680.1 protein-L-isoaspartate(D-aspartate) O-methyltransferase [Kiritimatiellales bacterium]